MDGDTRANAAVRTATDQLTALTGTAPRATREPPHRVHIEVDVTPALRQEWPRLLPLFELSDRFGLKTTSAGQTLWLRFETGEDTRP